MRLSVDEVAQVLRSAGATLVTADAVRLDVGAGAPTNADGTINLVHYAAWLIRGMARGD